MRNTEKAELLHLVKEQIEAGRDLSETTARLKRQGYTASTIRNYFKVAQSQKKEGGNK